MDDVKWMQLQAVEVYSDSTKQWCTGKITSIADKMLTIEYWLVNVEDDSTHGREKKLHVNDPWILSAPAPQKRDSTGAMTLWKWMKEASVKQADLLSTIDTLRDGDQIDFT